MIINNRARSVTTAEIGQWSMAANRPLFVLSSSGYRRRSGALGEGAVDGMSVGFRSGFKWSVNRYSLNHIPLHSASDLT